MTTDDRAREALREILRRHSYRPSPARGVERCACGDGMVGQPGWHTRHLADALLPVVVAEKAAAWDECLERVTSGVRSAMEAHRERGHRQIVAALSGLAGAVPQTDNPYRAALADDRENNEENDEGGEQ